ncbi:MAG: c-type cytochrome [Alphaproteobacteria bacterium GM202ARS2]|nr:c-type cytochrome [Alphaproteobacteria bacterium GM202ARS2]
MTQDPLLKVKIFGGILLSLFILTLGRSVSNKLYPPPPHKVTLAYAGEEAKTQQKTTEKITTAPVESTVDLATLLKDVDITAGKKIAAKCRTCHSLKKNGGIKIGPPLWGIIDSPAGAFFGFNYSTELKQKNIHWSVQNMNHFIKNPQEFIAGTKMRFNGIRKSVDRANLIGYLQTLNSTNGGTR